MDREADFMNLWNEWSDETSDCLVTGNKRLMDYLTTGGFFTAPAST